MTTIILEPPCDFINANDGLHWRAKAVLTKKWRQRTKTELLKVLVVPSYGRAHITVAIRFRDNVRRDVGNYFPTAKAIVDGLVDAHLIEDDNDLVVIGPDMRREYPNGPARVTVTITPLEQI